MSWKDQAGPATFRGVAFFVETTEFAGGRRAVIHEYPGQDLPFAEDLGRRARAFTLDGYVIGSDYLTAKSALIAKLETAGVGELVLPYYGSLRVQPTDFRVRESQRDGGFAQFSITFVETPAQPVQPSDTPDTAAALKTSAAALSTAAKASFLSRYNPGAVLTSVEGSMRGATNAINKAASRGQMLTQDAARLKKRAFDFVNAVATLARQPENLAAALVDMVTAIPTLLGVLDVYGFTAGTQPPATTANRVQEGKNNAALGALVQQIALAQAATVVAVTTFDSYEAALATQARLADLIDAQAEIAEDDVYSALTQLRAALVAAVPGTASDLPNLTAYTPRITLPSLVIAHTLYGSIDLEPDLVARNRIRNPGFVRGGQALRVLTDG